MLAEADILVHGEAMDLELAENAIKSVDLPDWVKAWRTDEKLDSDDEPMLQVWLEVDRILDVEDEAIYTELEEAIDKIRRAVWDAGISEWVHVVLTNPVQG